MKLVELKDLRQAIINWQNTVGAARNGQLEAFLGLQLSFADWFNTRLIRLSVEDKTAERIQTLLGPNHAVMIQTWLVRLE